MGINFQEVAQPRIDPSRCTVCGQCAEVCASGTLQVIEGQVRVGKRSFMGCIGCGQCMAVCPTRAIEVTGRRLAPSDVVELASAELPSPEQFDALLLARRSVRRFTDQEVDRSVVEQILAMASTAPVGIPPTEVGVLVFHGRERVRALAGEAIAVFEQLASRLNPVMLALMRPFMGKAMCQLMREFVRPLYTEIAAQWKTGRDTFTYDAPLALLFHSNVTGDAADEHIAATYAMLAAQSFGLGTCMLGTPAGLNQDRRFKAKYGIPPENKIGLGLVAGYPVAQYQRGIRRQWAGVRFA
jgi:ferredoxin